MRFTMNALVLATLAVGHTLAASVGNVHSAFHNHARKHDHAEFQKRAPAITDADIGKLSSLGVLSVGVNAVANNGAVWLGQDGPYLNEFINTSGQDLILVIWGVAGSWVNVVQAHVTASIPAGQSLWVSFAEAQSGAWTAVYSDTQLVNGQLSNTWGEYTTGAWGVVDVSREVNMSGHSMSIVGPTCTTDMNTCVFVCPSGNTCMYGYQLLNCGPGSQPNANYGIHEGAPSGGCGGWAAGTTIKTTLG